MLRRCLCQLRAASGAIDLTRLHATTVTSPLGGLLGQLLARNNASQVSYSSSTATATDPFTAKLQKNAEQQLLELMEAARAKKLAEQGQGKLEEDDDDEDMVEVVNKETGEAYGPRGKEPTRYGDWEIKGRCSDFA